MNRSGAVVVTEVVMAHGIKTVFSLGGAAHMRLLESLDGNGVRIIGGRHESAVVAAADGYGRITGRAGVAILIAEQGVANCYAGLLTAYYACSPVVLLMARFSPIYDDPHSNEEVSQFSGLRDVVKWSRTVPHQDRLGEYVEAAFRIAEGGRPGPVVLGVPVNLLEQSTSDWTPEPAGARGVAPQASRDTVAAVGAAIEAADRPIILAGSGARFGGAGAALTDVAETFGIPVIGRGLGRGVVDETTAGGWSWPVAVDAVAEADLVLAVGARVNQRMAYGLPPHFRRDVRIVQVDIAAEEMGGPRGIERTIIADAGGFTTALAAELRQRRTKLHSADWITAAVQPRRAAFNASCEMVTERAHPGRLAREVSRRLRDGIAVADGANVYRWFERAHEVRACPGWIDHTPLGSMGIGTGLAVGAAAAVEDTAADVRLLLMTGDGAIGYFISEFSTMSQHNLPIVTVIANDGAWGTERDGQVRAIGRTVNTELRRWNYAAVAEALGAQARTVRTSAELDEALDWAFTAACATHGPAVLNVEIDEDAGGELKDNPAYSLTWFDALVTQAAGIYSRSPTEATIKAV